MALDLTVTYPGQIDTSAAAAYPQGKAQNDIVEDDGVGTPLEKQWVNDLLGFLQSLLAEASVTPSGNPDEVGTSDYLDSLKQIISDEVLTTLRDDRLGQYLPDRIVLTTALAQNTDDRFGVTNPQIGYAYLQTDVTDEGQLLFMAAIPWRQNYRIEANIAYLLDEHPWRSFPADDAELDIFCEELGRIMDGALNDENRPIEEVECPSRSECEGLKCTFLELCSRAGRN